MTSTVALSHMNSLHSVEELKAHNDRRCVVGSHHVPELRGGHKVLWGAVDRRTAEEQRDEAGGRAAVGGRGVPIVGGMPIGMKGIVNKWYQWNLVKYIINEKKF